MLRTNAFDGANVFMSRNLVPPEVFDTLHDALKNNGARVHLCCDPSRNGPHDYHIISHDHEKLEDLKANGCNLLGPQCVLSCAKEQRPLPKRGFTCCLAMDGVKVLASGFDMDEKMKIGELVNSMGGILHTKASLDVNFVIVKNVLAAKYKWALNMLKKPLITFNWLKQCSVEHRIVPQDSYRILPFSGLTICVTRIPADERRKIEMLIVQNGGKYSAELTKKCTHLISDAPEGDKYKVAKRWGHIHIVTKKWFDQSISRRACLNEESYPVQHGPVSSQRMSMDNLTARHSQEKENGKLQSAASSGFPYSSMPSVSYADLVDGDPDATQSENTSAAILGVPIFVNATDPEAPPVQPQNEPNIDSAIARDSESDDDDLYLSECRISLVGFEASEMRKLVNMVRKGGGSRYMSLNDKLTHIVIGTPSEIEKKDVRSLAALGIIYVVNTTWLEDCDREKKEVPVLKKHIAQDLLLPKGSASFVKGSVTGIMYINKGKDPSTHQSLQADQVITGMDSRVVMPLSVEKKEKKPEIDLTDLTFLKAMDKSIQQTQLPVVNNKVKGQKKMHNESSQCVKSSTVFWGRTFCFSNSFPEERRDEIIQWIGQGKGEIVNGHRKQNAHYTIECHGVTRRLEEISQTTYISSHWIRSCLENDCLLHVDSHILYSPLPCHIPLPGFEGFRFCVSQYEGRDRMLLRNLCFVLGATFVEKLTKKVTHLLCKFINGPKYEAACKWGIQAVTSEWIFECVKQNKVAAVDQFLPKEVSVNQEDGVFTVSQFPNPADSISGDCSAQFSSRSQNLRNMPNQNVGSQLDNYGVDAKISSVYNKRARLLEESSVYDTVPSAVASATPIYNTSSTGKDTLMDTGAVSPAVPDVAAAIEDLLEQTSKMHDQTSPGKTVNKGNNLSSDCSVLGENQSNPHAAIGFSEHWLNRSSKNEDNDDASRDGRAAYDNFSETQTESQVVGYEEDLSGRQMLIDRVRTRSMA